ncbi:DsbA family protein [Kangiella sp. HD9-110m-PIT-SAG07]|nr:DsbA family protein [Kangiella sp. HD9-110m-PIT-SAG07]
MPVKLFYFHDPMCSWCWGFAPTWQRLQDRINSELNHKLKIEYILGGLAPDSDEPMPLELQQTLQSYWRRIEQMLGTEFNHDFWAKCQPRRSTYPACRAVIAAGKQGKEKAMIRAIQEAYYLKAKNPSDYSTHVDLAQNINLNEKAFAQDIHSDKTNEELHRQIQLHRSLPSNGFPSLVIEYEKGHIPIPVDYKHVEPMFDRIKSALNNSNTGESHG